MRALIETAFLRSRSVSLVFLLVVGFGIYAYQVIPKEAEPDLTIPVIYVSMAYEGISPEDAERLLVRPMERELSGIEGLSTRSRAPPPRGLPRLPWNSMPALMPIRPWPTCVKAWTLPRRTCPRGPKNPG